MTKWSERRVARLGFLVGLGWDAARIARDPTVRCETGEVHRQVAALGLTMRETVSGTPYNLDGKRMAFFEASARRRRLPTEALLRKILEGVDEERAIDLILDPALV